jgi:hypothetical protein
MGRDCKAKGHIGKVVKWDYILKDGQMHSDVGLWGCTECDATSETVWPDFGTYDTTKEECKENCNCFGCKVKTLQMNTGDTTRDISDKKWNAELNAYRDARDQGIRPGGTSMAHIEAAHVASENLGKAYNAETMPKAHQINKKTAEVMKEVGL